MFVSSVPGGILELYSVLASKAISEVHGAVGCCAAGPLISCIFFPEHFLLLQSVSALLDKFKKSDQVFDINAEIDSDVEDCVPALPNDDFHSDSPRSTAADRIGEFTENLNSFGTVHQSKR